MRIPEKHEVTDFGYLKELCLSQGWDYEYEFIKDVPDHIKFSSDGCSWWPDKRKGVSYYVICFRHDLVHAVGGTDIERYECNRIFMDRIVECTGDPDYGVLMFVGVHNGGRDTFFDMPFEWGYMRDEIEAAGV